MREDVEQATDQKLPERLPRLHARGLLDREDVHAPHLTRPAWIYRINQAGGDRVAEEADLPLRVIPGLLRHGPERQMDAAVYIPPGAVLALRELCCAMDARVESRHLPGERGWRNAADLREQFLGEDPARSHWEPRSSGDAWMNAREVDETELLPGEPWMGDHDGLDQVAREEREWGWDPLVGELPLGPTPRTPLPDDLRWLVRVGLVQQWTAQHPGRRRVTLYRITPLGGVVIPLEWREPR
ncbi:MAG: hypothetical protein AB1941_00960 [Gemmatimonadota bacterium]